MRSCWQAAGGAVLLMCGCNAAGTEVDEISAGSQPSRNQASSAQSNSASLLESSTPADGARLPASPEILILAFRVPVRLQEVTVRGSDGQTMPMMITAAGPLRSFSVPLPYLEPALYSVQWRATDEAGNPHEGTFGFVIG